MNISGTQLQDAVGGRDGVVASRRKPIGLWLTYALVAACTLGVFVSQLTGGSAPSFFLELILVQILYATSVNLLIGYSNLPSFGQAAFFGSGAYTAALVAGDVNIFFALALAVVVSAAIAAALGTLVVRTSGIAFANITLAFGQMLYLLVFNTKLVGGENGIAGVGFRPLSPTDFWILLNVCVVGGVALLWWLLKTPFGVTLLAIRDNPARATALGVGVYGFRLKAFTIAGAFAGLAGALFAFSIGIVTPDLLNWTRSGDPIIMSVLGGSKFFLGPAVGAMVLTTLVQHVGGSSAAYLLYVGGILLAILIIAPRGLLSIPQEIRRLLRNRREGARQPRIEARAGEPV